MREQIKGVVDFFAQLSETLLDELRALFTGQVVMAESEGSGVMTIGAVVDVLRSLESLTLSTVSSESKRIGLLAGTLTCQLMQQAREKDCDIAPIVSELESEALVNYVLGKEESPKRKEAEVLDQELRAMELTQDVVELQRRVKELEKELSDKVQNTTQYRNLVKMLRTKTEEVEALEMQLKER
ncbi:hypothetical protein GMRT_16280 [Giardia muris]|uniref:Leucine zipper transcription factor-like protein 1 n=1 Tax=Giardia muris TaxID=5742 RepID=A0A4Z1SUV9_GIAMU|nr:hypothetical protein GMRT_16280 [Giardia muris]|eukprot:TNJ29626.1 hypothetical protein GMRT_16280 [Giardia muris]